MLQFSWVFFCLSRSYVMWWFSICLYVLYMISSKNKIRMKKQSREYWEQKKEESKTSRFFRLFSPFLMIWVSFKQEARLSAWRKEKQALSFLSVFVQKYQNRRKITTSTLCRCFFSYECRKFSRLFLQKCFTSRVVTTFNILREI